MYTCTREEPHLNQCLGEKLTVPVSPRLPTGLSPGSVCQHHCHLLPEIVSEVLQINAPKPLFADFILSSLNGCSCPLAAFPRPPFKSFSSKTDFRSNLPILLSSSGASCCQGDDVSMLQDGDQALSSPVQPLHLFPSFSPFMPWLY